MRKTKTPKVNPSQIYTYNFPTNIRFGPGATNELSPYLKDQNLINPLIVTDPQVRQLDFFKKIIGSLASQKISAHVFSEINKNPIKSNVLAGRDAFNKMKCDSIIGIGGGASMDVARAVALSIHNKRDLFDYDDLEGGAQYVTEPIPHFITIPTTSGTGSEVGRAAVISEDDSKRKRILFHPKLMAKIVFADPELTYELPPPITAATGMDALTHNMEAYLAKGYHPMCDGIALEGTRLIFRSIDTAVNHPDPKSRSNMMLASLMGAVAFQKGLGIVHALSHPLSTLLDMHHGLANAINLPHGLRFNIPGQEPRFQNMAHGMGLPNLDGQSVAQAITELNQRIGLPLNLKEVGVTRDIVPALSDLAVNDFCLPANPRDASIDDIKELYYQAVG
ncbi:MAG: iron-containing alcohol dehydrogenase [Cyclobacteriaceae bacterium]